MENKNGYTELKEKLIESGQYDIDLIDRAYEIALSYHDGQLRYSGETYVSHPISVAKILVELGMDSQCVVAGLLHDIVEDTDVTVNMIEEQFGKDVAVLVDGVTKLGKVPTSTREETQAENIRKMLMAMNEDVRVVIIKLADRLHNMRTLSFMRPQKQRDKSLEVLEIYAPIAHRLGIRTIKEELEDLAIKYLDPIAYKEIEDKLNMKAVERRDFLDTIKDRIGERIHTSVETARIGGRVKSVHGIYRKVYMKNRSFDEIYDIFAVRIIVDSVIDCYNCLGIIHDMFKPIPGRFKDYISTPKQNMYQSLHTTVLGKEGIPFEVQIRTWDMHRTAEYGIAAHWKYKLGVKGEKSRVDERLAWIRQMLENQNENNSPEELVNTIKSDLAVEDVFVFTPKGDVINIPAGSTVIDFAYAIHSAVGNRMIGAKVDGRIVPLEYELKTGEIVEVLTTSNESKGPSRDWLKICRTSEARTKIRAWFKKERREENIIEGKAEFEREIKRNNIRLTNDEFTEFVEKIAGRQHCNSSDDFFSAIGYGGIIVSRLIPYIKEEYNRSYKAKEPVMPKLVKEGKPKSNEGVVVEGIDNCLIKFSKCCNPLPGDEIIGFVTRGHGLSIHKRDCVNVPKDLENSSEPERWINASWDKNVKVEFKSTLSVFATDVDGLLANLTMELANMHVKVHSLNARALGSGNSITTITLTVDGTEHLKNVINKIQKISGIISIERSGL